jgi:hypothetical protein
LAWAIFRFAQRDGMRKKYESNWPLALIQQALAAILLEATSSIRHGRCTKLPSAGRGRNAHAGGKVLAQRHGKDNVHACNQRGWQAG